MRLCQFHNTTKVKGVTKVSILQILHSLTLKVVMEMAIWTLHSSVDVDFFSLKMKQNTECITSMLYHSGAGSFGLFSCVLDGVERQQSHRAVYRLKHMISHRLIVTCPDKHIRLNSVHFLMPSFFRFVPRHADELCLETDDPVLMLNESEDLWCQGYNMRTGATGIFPAFYAVRLAKDISQGTLQRAGL